MSSCLFHKVELFTHRMLKLRKLIIPSGHICSHHEVWSLNCTFDCLPSGKGLDELAGGDGLVPPRSPSPLSAAAEGAWRGGRKANGPATPQPGGAAMRTYDTEMLRTLRNFVAIKTVTNCPGPEPS